MAGLGLAGVGLAATPFAPMTVDQLRLTIVDDKESFGPFLPDLELPGLRVQRGGNGAPTSDARVLQGEFGLSVLAESRRGDAQRRVMVDFGYTAAAMANNLALLGIDPAGLDAAVLSHGHLDHHGGVSALRPRSGVPLVMGGEEAFCARVAMLGPLPSPMRTMDRAALRAAGWELTLSGAPVSLAGHGFTTGTIPVSAAEPPAIPTMMRPGDGCDRALLSPGKRDADMIADDAEHELATCYVVKDHGLVVIASCSHRGVVNSVRRAQAVSGVQQVHLVIGGFHLVRPRSEADARAAAAALAAIGPRWLVPMHCSGEVFVDAARALMGARVVRPYVGTRLTVG